MSGWDVLVFMAIDLLIFFAGMWWGRRHCVCCTRLLFVMPDLVPVSDEDDRDQVDS